MTRVPILILATTLIPQVTAIDPRLRLHEHQLSPSLPDRKHAPNSQPSKLHRRTDGELELMECGYLPRDPHLPPLRLPSLAVVPRRPSSSNASSEGAVSDNLAGPSSPRQQAALRKERAELREHQRQLQRIWRQGNQSPVFRSRESQHPSPDSQYMTPVSQIMDSAEEIEPAAPSSGSGSLDGGIGSIVGEPGGSDGAASASAQREAMGRSVSMSVHAQCVRCVRGCLGGFLNVTDAMTEYCEGICGEAGFRCALVVAGCVSLIGTLTGMGLLLNELKIG